MPSPDPVPARRAADPWTPSRGSPVAETLRLYVGVFFIFAPVMTLFVSDLAPDRDWSRLLLWFGISGVIGVLYAAAGTWRRWIMWPAIALHILCIVSMMVRRPEWLFLENRGLRLEGMAVVVCIGVGYFLFVRHIRDESTRTQRLQAELDLAGQIHRSLVPPLELRVPGAEVFGRSEPSTEMGGDLIDVVVHSGVTDLYLADVAGHGVKAGVLMGMVKSAIRMRLSSSLETAPLALLVSDLNRLVCQVSTPEMFVTFAALRIGPAATDGSRPIECAMAGHLPTFLVRAASGRAEPLENGSLPLGVLETESFEPLTITVHRGDLLALYTDGLTEASDRSGRQFGLTELESVLAAAAPRPLEDVHRTVMAAVRAHTGRSDRADDQSLLLARIT